MIPYHSASPVWLPNATINMQVINADTEVTTTVGSVLSDANGGGSYAFPMSGTPGSYILNITDASGNNVSVPFTLTQPPIYALTITPKSPANLTATYSQQFDAFIQYNQTDASVYHDNTDVQWTSSNPSVASISSFGIVTGLTAGTAQIYCTYEGVSRQ